MIYVHTAHFASIITFIYTLHKIRRNTITDEMLREHAEIQNLFKRIRKEATAMILPCREHGQENSTEKGIRSIQEEDLWNNPEQDGLARHWMTKRKNWQELKKERLWEGGTDFTVFIH